MCTSRGHMSGSCSMDKLRSTGRNIIWYPEGHIHLCSLAPPVPFIEPLFLQVQGTTITDNPDFRHVICSRSLAPNFFPWWLRCVTHEQMNPRQGRHRAANGRTDTVLFSPARAVPVSLDTEIDAAFSFALSTFSGADLIPPFLLSQWPFHFCSAHQRIKAKAGWAGHDLCSWQPLRCRIGDQMEPVDFFCLF
jgi:hypothetical protein